VRSDWRENVLIPSAVALSVSTVAFGFSSPLVVPLRYGATLLIAVLWLVVVLSADRRRGAHANPWFIGGLSGMAAAVMLSALGSPAAQDALTWGFRETTSAPYWIACLVVLAGACSVSINRRVRWGIGLGVAIVATAGLSAVFQRVGGLDQSDTLWGGSNYLGPLCVLVVPVALGLARTTGSRPQRVAWIAAAVAAMTGAIGSGSSTALGAFLVAGMLVTVWRPTLLWIDASHIRLARTIALAIAGIGIGMLLLASTTDLLPGPVESAIRGEVFGVTASQRVELWKVAASAGAARPVIGWGPGVFQYASQGFVTPRMMLAENVVAGMPDPRAVLPADPHSFPLKVFAELGILGLVALGVLVGAWLLSVYRVPPGPERAQDLRAALGIGVIGMAVASLAVPVDPGLGLIGIAFAGLAVTGGATTLDRAVEAKGRPRGAAAKAPGTDALLGPLRWVAVALALVSAVALSVPLWQSVSRVERAFANATDARVLSSQLTEAARLVPGRSMLVYQRLWADANRVGGDLTLDEFRQLFESAPEPARTFAPFTTELVGIVVAQLPSAETYQWADAVLGDAIARAPGYPASYAERARVALLRGDQERARDLLDQVSWARASTRYQDVSAMLESP